MKISDYRTFRIGFPHHVYTKAENGFVIFYSPEDCIFYLTLYFSLVLKYGIEVLAFDIMPNHTHSNERASCREDFRKFHSALESQFVAGYNLEHNRKGPLFQSPFGYAPKMVAKRIKDNLCYIANNEVVGNMKDSVLKSRWNMLAYFENDHPFSEKLVIRRSSWKMKKAVKMVRSFRESLLPLNYQRQRIIFNGLSAVEKAQITDYIISKYNCVNYKAVASYFSGTMEKAILVMESNSGSEHDIPEDFENYGKYVEMAKRCLAKGIDLKTVNFEHYPREELRKMIQMLKTSDTPLKQIYKFLHIKSA